MTFWDFLYRVLPTRDSIVYLLGIIGSGVIFLASDMDLVHTMFETTPQQERWIIRLAFLIGIGSAKLHKSPAGLSDKAREEYQAKSDTVRIGKILQ